MSKTGPGQSDLRALLTPEERYPELARRIAEQRTWLEAQRCALELAPGAHAGLLGALGERLTAVSAALLDELGPATADAFEREVARLPELQRLLALAGTQFRAVTAELMRRVASDAGALAALLGAAAPPDAITRLTLGLSDPHADGRSVVVVELGALRAVYKPRDLGSAARFFALCEALAPVLPLPLHQRALLLRDGYGYEAFVAESACPDEPAVQRYYVRAGCILRLLEVLGGRDFHAENVRAAGEHPVLLDLETVIGVSGYAEGMVTAEQRAWQLRADSLLATGLVPDWEPGRAGPADHSGLAIRPRLSGSAQAIDRAKYVDDVIDGYLRTARSLQQPGPIEAVLREQPAIALRHIQRPTPFYTRLLARSVELELLADGARREAFLRAELGDGPLVEQELAALMRMDVPLFGAVLGERAVREACAEERVEVLAGDAFAAIEERRTRAPTPEMIESAFATGPWPARTESESESGSESESDSEPGSVSDAELVRAACEIGDLILASAIEASGPALSWLGLVHIPGLGGRLLHRLPPDLLSGTAGVAIVLARLYAVSKEQRCADASRRALQQALRRLEVTVSEPPAADLDLGGHTGLGAWLFAAIECGRRLEDQALIVRARELARAVPRALLGRGPGSLSAGASGLFRALTVAGVETAPPTRPSAEVQDPGAQAARPETALASQTASLALLSSRPPPATAASSTGDLLVAARVGGPNSELALHRAQALARSPHALDRIDALELAVVLGRHPNAEAARVLARRLAADWIARRSASGRWLPRELGADQHNLSALFGITAVCDLLLRVAHPGRFGSLRLLE